MEVNRALSIRIRYLSHKPDEMTIFPGLFVSVQAIEGGLRPGGGNGSCEGGFQLAVEFLLQVSVFHKLLHLLSRFHCFCLSIVLHQDRDKRRGSIQERLFCELPMPFIPGTVSEGWSLTRRFDRE